METAASEEKISARDALITECQAYVCRVASSLIRRLALPFELREDLTAAGYLGLVEAAERFDFREGSSFRPFAFLRIRGAIIDCVRRSSDLSASGYRMAKALRAAHDLREEGGAQYAKKTGSSRAGLAHILDYAAKGALAYRLSMNGREARRSSAFHDLCDPGKKLEVKQEEEIFRKIVATLPEKERLIIEEYYFNDKSFSDISEEYSGMSKSWISRLHARALERLKEAFLQLRAEESGQNAASDSDSNSSLRMQRRDSA